MRKSEDVSKLSNIQIIGVSERKNRKNKTMAGVAIINKITQKISLMEGHEFLYWKASISVQHKNYIRSRYRYKNSEH